MARHDGHPGEEVKEEKEKRCDFLCVGNSNVKRRNVLVRSTASICSFSSRESVGQMDRLLAWCGWRGYC